MAFNPFHRFRKHQKVFFAILTIVCMITFIFSFGQGDLVHQVMAWFGASRAKGEMVLKLHGNKVYEGELYELGQRRKAASAVLSMWADKGAQITLQQLEKQLSDKKANIPPAVANALREQKNLQQNDMERIRRGQMPMPRDVFFREQLINLRTALWALEGEGASGGEGDQKDVAAEQTRYLERTITVFSLLAYAFSPGTDDEELPANDRNAPRARLYFGGQTNTDGLLDFLIWKHQADRLGIVLTDEGLRRELTREAAGEDLIQKKDLRTILMEFQQNNPFLRGRDTVNLKPDELIAALKDEFRVAMAKEALLGGGPGVRKYRNEALGINPPPSTPTPDQFLEFYREQRTTLRVALLALPVEHFMSQVKGEPSAEEVENLWQTYRDVEYNPTSPTPGYKIPKRIRVQVASGSPEEPAYQKEADAIAPLQAALPYLFPPQAGLVPWATMMTGAISRDPILERYAGYRRDVSDSWLFTRSFKLDVPQDAIPAKPGLPIDSPTQELAQVSIVGQGLMGGSTPLGPMTALGLLQSAEALHRRAVAEAVAVSMLAPTVRMSPFTAVLLPHPFFYSKASLEQALPVLWEDYRKTVAAQIFDKNIRTFDEELKKLSTKPAEAAKYATEAAKKYHLTLRESGEVTPYTAEYDPTIKLLQKSFRYDNQPDALTQDLFTDAAKRYVPTEARGEKDRYVWWRIAYQPASTPTFQAAKSEIEDTWRLTRARVLAHNEANRIERELKDKPATERVPFLRDQPVGKVFELDNVARLVAPRMEVLMGQTPEYRPYELPSKYRDNMRYPPPNLADKLMSLKKPGDSIVFADAPGKHYFVAVLVARPKIYVPEVMLHYRGAPQDPLWRMMVAEQQREFVQRIRRDLRRDAVGAQNLTSDGDFIINDKVRQRIDGGRDSGD